MAITVQRGVKVLTGDSDTVTLGTTVDLSRSFIIVDGSTDSVDGSTGFQDWGVTGVITDGDTITLAREGFTQDGSVSWQVVTCDQKEFLIVARGLSAIATGDSSKTVAVPETDPNRTMMMYNSKGNFGITESNLGFITGSFDSTTQILFERGGTSTTRTNLAYEIIEWSYESGVTVAKGLIDAAGLTGVTETSTAHGSTVTTTNTWLFAQARHESNGLEQCAVRVRFDTTNILLKRYDAASTLYDSHVAWQLVTFPVSNCEQRTPALLTGEILHDTNTTLVMDTGATIVWMTNSCNGTGTALGRNAWTSQVLDSTTIRSLRSYDGQASEGAISICDFSLLTSFGNLLLGGFP